MSFRLSEGFANILLWCWSGDLTCSIAWALQGLSGLPANMLSSTGLSEFVLRFYYLTFAPCCRNPLNHKEAPVKMCNI